MFVCGTVSQYLCRHSWGFFIEHIDDKATADERNTESMYLSFDADFLNVDTFNF